MMSTDLVVLAADKSIEQATRNLLTRSGDFKIRPITFAIFVHPNHDSGCRQNSAELLRSFLRTHSRALVIFDRHGCGSPDSASELQSSVELKLTANGWQDRCRAIAIDPELETWVWTPSPHVTQGLGWPGSYGTLIEWLAANGFGLSEAGKPIDPKAALRRCLRSKNIPWSASLFGTLASQVAIDGCSDAAFQRLRTTLAEWFPPS
jgi:hypothetical protein